MGSQKLNNIKEGAKKIKELIEFRSTLLDRLVSIDRYKAAIASAKKKYEHGKN